VPLVISSARVAVRTRQRAWTSSPALAWHLPNFFTGLLIDATMNDASPFSSSHCTITRLSNRIGDVPCAHADRAEISELRFPREIAFEVVRVKTFGAEEGIDELAVGCRLEAAYELLR
jgi:hypothetical protein